MWQPLQMPSWVLATGGICNGCHIGVPPMMFQQIIRREELFQCPNCQRILYYAPKKAGDDTGADADADATEAGSTP